MDKIDLISVSWVPDPPDPACRTKGPTMPDPTPEAIREMPAGRELDELIATRVMGWHKKPPSWFWWDAIGLRQNRCEAEDDGVFGESRWMPSEEVADAFDVMGKLREHFRSLGLYTTTKGPGWTLTVWGDCKKGEESSPIIGCGETPALAICRCALLTLWEKP